MPDVLEQAYMELRSRYQVADSLGDWQARELLRPLASIADYTKRIALPTATPHYQAEKGGELLDNAISLQSAALSALAGWPEEGPTAAGIEKTFQLLQSLTEVIVTAGWAAARNEKLDTAWVAKCKQVTKEMEKWGSEQSKGAIPTPATW